MGALALGVTGSAGVNPGPVTSIAAPLADWNAGLWLEEGFDPSPPRVPFAGLSCDPISSDPARAGKDTESLDAAIARLAASTAVHGVLADLAATNGGTLDGIGQPALLSAPVPRQAVTPPDLERLALDCPDASVQRVRTLVDTDPDLPGLAAPGTVTLVVLPGLPKTLQSPSANLIRRLNAWLQPLRGLGTRLRVIGPSYAAQDLSATLRVKSGCDATKVKTAAEQALRDWLDPLGNGGDSGTGPPVFGRDILRSEALTKLAQVAGVAEVDGLTLTAAADAPALWTPRTLPTWGSIKLKTEAAT